MLKVDTENRDFLSYFVVFMYANYYHYNDFLFEIEFITLLKAGTFFPN